MVKLSFVLQPTLRFTADNVRNRRMSLRRLRMMSSYETGTAESGDQLLRRKGYRPGDNVIMFDGVCSMCNAGVDFVVRNDTRRQFKFAALQSESGKALAEKFKCPSDLSTMVYIEGEDAFVKSDAMLRIGRRLGLFFSLPSELALFAVPKPIRDFAYTDIIAKYRYDVFGKRDECRFVEPGEEHRFLD